MEGAAPSLFSPLLFLGFLLLFMYIVIIRPQNKRNKEITEMLTNLDVGTEVIAASGIIGKVKAIKGDYISLEVSDNVVFKLQKSAIANILPKGTIDSIKQQKVNKFSIYQYILILVILVVGSIYALPNLYPTQPSIQSHTLILASPPINLF